MLDISFIYVYIECVYTQVYTYVCVYVFCEHFLLFCQQMPCQDDGAVAAVISTITAKPSTAIGTNTNIIQRNKHHVNIGTSISPHVLFVFWSGPSTILDVQQNWGIAFFKHFMSYLCLFQCILKALHTFS